MEELLKQLLEGQKQLFVGQKQLFVGQEQLFESHKELVEGQRQLIESHKQLFEGHKELVEGHKQLFEGQRQLFEGQNQILNRLDNLEGQVRENTDYIKAVLHRTDELDAKFDGLLHTTLTKDAISHLATKEDVVSLDVKMEALNVRLFHQEAELCRLKVVK